MPREILGGHRVLQGKLAEILYSGDPRACADVLGRMWVHDSVACENGLVAITIYRPTILRILKLDKSYILDDVEFYRVRLGGRIYNGVVGRKAYALMPFATPYIAITSFYHKQFSSIGTAVPAVFYALVDQSSLVDARDPRKKHKKVFGGGSITLEVCGRENIQHDPRCVDLASVELVYRGKGRLALAHSPAAIRILKLAQSLLKEGEETAARVVLKSFLDSLGIEAHKKTTDDLVAMVQALHQPHRVIRFSWRVNVNEHLPQELRDSLRAALGEILRAASVRLGGKWYVAAFSVGRIERAVDTKHVVISPAPQRNGDWQGNENWKEVPPSGIQFELERLESVRVVPARRPVKRAVLYSEAQKRAVLEVESSTRVLRSGRRLIINGAAELEYTLNEHAHEAYYRVYLGSGSWEAVFYRYR